MRSFSTALALVLALSSGQSHVDAAEEQSKRLRSNVNVDKTPSSDRSLTSLNEKARNLLLDFSGYQFWDDYSKGMSSMAPVASPTPRPVAPPTPAPYGPPVVTRPPVMTYAPTPEFTLSAEPTGYNETTPTPAPVAVTYPPAAAPIPGSTETPAPVAVTYPPAAAPIPGSTETPAPVAVTYPPAAAPIPGSTETPAPVYSPTAGPAMATEAPVVVTYPPAAAPIPGSTETPAPVYSPTAGPASPPAMATEAPVYSPTAGPASPPAMATEAPVVVTAPPTVVTAAPSVVTAPPTNVTAAPSVVTAPPTNVTAAPSVVTAPPTVVTAAPSVATPAPVVATSPAPVVTTPAPVLATPAPVVATPAPVVATPAPVTTAPTAAPVQTAAPTTRAPSVASRLQPYLLQGGSELTDPNSYQSCAVQRTSEQVGVDAFSDAKLTQYYALYSIFCSTNAVPNVITDADPRFDGIATFPGWRTSTGWTSTTMDPCSGWHGVVCVNDQVTELNLFDNLMTGIWPKEVTLLASDGPPSTGAGAISKIDLFKNEFLFNDFDNSWMSSLGSAMQKLYFQATAMAGSLAPLPPNLFEFDCSFTLIDGGLNNANFAGLNNLNWALLDGNAYNSSVPSVFNSLPQLEFLFISDAFISGDLSYMVGMPKMVEHWVDVNPGLKGPIPAGVGNIATLKSWSVTQGSLTGQIPSELGKLTNMVQMWLYANALSGTIPPELALRTLKILQLEGNSFGGSMPDAICALRGAFPTLTILGADCAEIGCPTSCCTCCDLAQCNPNLFS